MDIKNLKDKTVLIIGAGKTGIASAFFLLDKAKKVLLSELSKSKDKVETDEDKIQNLQSNGVETEFGQNSVDFIHKADLVIISPGISPQSEIVNKITSLKKPIISEIELAKYFIHKPIVAVTGTNGKTTTTALITHILNCSGKKAVACGNIGKPLIEVISSKDYNDIDYFVLEISSFQIFYSPTLSCDIAICLNITPDHLDWHGDFNNYVETKSKLFKQQQKNSWAILNFSDTTLKNFKIFNNKFCFSSMLVNILSFDNLAYLENNILKVKTNNKITEIISKDDLKILGTHNIENALASIAVCKIINIRDTEIRESLKSFKGVEHRLEYIRTINNTRFYNDSKATNPEATIKAIEAFQHLKERKIILILGGKDKHTRLDEMIQRIKKNVDKVILLGEAKERFQKELVDNNFKDLIIVNNIKEAIDTSLKCKPDIVLFSPACASFDMFKNYEERGKLFKELVNKI